MRSLIMSGMDVARVNFSHGDHEMHGQVISMVREESRRQKKVVSVLQDLQGIKIRLGDVAGESMMLRTGHEVSIYPGRDISTTEKLFISYPALLKDVKEGEHIVIDDGLIKLTVTGKSPKLLRAKVTEGGVVKSRRASTSLHQGCHFMPLLRRCPTDLEFGLSLDVDYVAVFCEKTGRHRCSFEMGKTKRDNPPSTDRKNRKTRSDKKHKRHY